MPDQLAAQLLAELVGVAALGVAIIWQPAHRCRWEHCPHHGKRPKDELRLEQERLEGEVRERGSDRRR